jgi:NAD-dependent dihydropyrimidine dehydrogenase PreA subunit
MIGEKYLSDVVTLKLTVEKCTGCTMCTVVCPHAVFAMNGKKAQIVNRDICMECGACALNCPAKAIYVKSGVGCAAGIIYGILNNTEPTCSCSGNSSACC